MMTYLMLQWLAALAGGFAICCAFNHAMARSWVMACAWAGGALILIAVCVGLLVMEAVGSGQVVEGSLSLIRP